MAKAVAYLSHSYRPEDRAINMAVWRLLNALGVAFAVDPPSADRPMDVTFLERMMQRSSCFIAIVPDRSRAGDGVSATPTWSPYQEFECRLAIRANKPRLIVVEQGIELGPLSEGQRTLWFTRSPLQLDPDLPTEVRRFVEKATPREPEPGTLPKMGILRWTPTDPRWDRLSTALIQRIGRNVATFVDVGQDTHDHDLLSQARNLTMLVADVNPEVTPGHVTGLLHGAAVPIFRTCVLRANQDEARLALAMGLGHDDAASLEPAADDGRVTAPAVRWPLLFRGYRVDTGMRPIHFWKASAVEETAAAIAQVTKGYRNRERRLETQQNADDYFLKLRGNRVFISTASELSAWSIPVKTALETAGMPAFHYKVSDIAVGDEWMPELRKRIADADLFLAFVSPGYWTSDVCIDELALAIERWERHQLILVMCTPSDRPSLPTFLNRYQTEALSEAERDIPTIVAHVQARFQRRGRSDTASVDLIGGPLARVLQADRTTDIGAFLARVCGLPDNDATDIADRAGGDAFRVVEALICRGRAGNHDGFALGRLCLWLRRRVDEPETRRALTRQFSLLRLFPKLHDLRAWNERRTRRDIEGSISGAAPRQALETLSLLAGDHDNPLDAVKRVGSEIAAYVSLPDREALATHERCRVSIVSSIDDLTVPVEWAVLPGMSAPLARLYPVSRHVAHSGAGRESIEAQLEAGAAAPPRVLLCGYGPPDLPYVDKEIRALRELFVRRYAENEWPGDLIECITGALATPDALGKAIAGTDLDILHLAGHAEWADSGPVIAIAAPGGGSHMLSSTTLGQWLQRSSVRLVYLNCCGAAAAPLASRQFAGWRQTFFRDVVEAGVAEVAGYFWPVPDDEAGAFALQFYTAYLRAFDAPGAMLSARQSEAQTEMTWAGSVLVQAAHRTIRP